MEKVSVCLSVCPFLPSYLSFFLSFPSQSQPYILNVKIILGRRVKKKKKETKQNRQKTLTGLNSLKFNFIHQLLFFYISLFALRASKFNLICPSRMKEVWRTSGVKGQRLPIRKPCRLHLSHSTTITKGRGIDCPLVPVYARPSFLSSKGHPKHQCFRLHNTLLNIYMEQIPISASLPRTCIVAVLFGD